jgi:Uncharacterized protein conserved in bacteria (DUF2066)
MTVTLRNRLPRAAVLAIALILAAATGARAQEVDRTPASAASTFTVSGIPVDVTAENAVAARERAIETGQREGLARLLRRLAPAEQYGRLPSTDGLRLDRFVRNFDISNEQLSTTRYIARLNVTYDPAAVRDLLREAGVPFAETLSEPVLLLPLFETPEGLRLWQEGNPWWDAWSQAMDRESLLRLRLPLGDLEDEQAIAQDLEDLDGSGGAYAPAGQRPPLRRIAERYDAEGVIVAHAQVGQSPSDEQPDRPVVVDVNAQGFGGVDVADVAETVRGEPGQGIEEVLLEAVLRVQDALNEAWKAPNLLRFDRPATMLVDVPFDSLQGWVEVQRALASLPEIGEVEVRSFSQEGARVRIAYYGEAPRLQAELAGLGLLLAQQEGDTWQLLRTGEVPGRDTPFGAAPTSF